MRAALPRSHRYGASGLFTLLAEFFTARVGNYPGNHPNGSKYQPYVNSADQQNYQVIPRQH
ncbi:MAG: hypothetical protein C5B51_04890 [Terriglobia bacterium]|nr:MAG: hypothetical protein C5B51_04890 [Terriglobia bacterium]